MDEQGIPRGGVGKCRGFFLGFVTALVVAVSMSAGIDSFFKARSSPEYCGSCHELEDAYNSWTGSVHNVNAEGLSVACIECHLPPRDNYLKYTCSRIKTGAKDALKHYFSDDFDAEKLRKEVREHMPPERCLRCHGNLVAEPRNGAIRIAHTESLAKLDSEHHTCLACHERLHSPKAVPAARKKYELADNSFCYVCHINWEQEEFVESHRRAGVACWDCHGISEAHMDDEEHMTPPDIMFTKEKANASCMTADCHPRPEMEEEMGHKPFFAGATDLKQCTDCHGEHRLNERKRRWDKVTGEIIEVKGDLVMGM